MSLIEPFEGLLTILRAMLEAQCETNELLKALIAQNGDRDE